MNPTKAKELQKLFEEGMDGKWQVSSVGDLWYYSEDLQKALEKVYKAGKEAGEKEMRRIFNLFDEEGED